MIRNADWQFPAGSCEAARCATASVGAEGLGALRRRAGGRPSCWATRIYTNPLLLGYAWQKGRIPLTHASLMRAMDLNGVQVANNQAAFEWGRRCAHNLAEVQALFKPRSRSSSIVRKPSVDEDGEASRVEFLTGYQDASYAAGLPRPSSRRCAPPRRKLGKGHRA